LSEAVGFADKQHAGLILSGRFGVGDESLDQRFDDVVAARGRPRQFMVMWQSSRCSIFTSAARMKA
jgi:hypothetical protein